MMKSHKEEGRQGSKVDGTKEEIVKEEEEEVNS